MSTGEKQKTSSEITHRNDRLDLKAFGNLDQISKADGVNEPPPLPLKEESWKDRWKLAKLVCGPNLNNDARKR